MVHTPQPSFVRWSCPSIASYTRFALGPYSVHAPKPGLTCNSACIFLLTAAPRPQSVPCSLASQIVYAPQPCPAHGSHPAALSHMQFATEAASRIRFAPNPYDVCNLQRVFARCSAPQEASRTHFAPCSQRLEYSSRLQPVTRMRFTPRSRVQQIAATRFTPTTLG